METKVTETVVGGATEGTAEAEAAVFDDLGGDPEGRTSLEELRDIAEGAEAVFGPTVPGTEEPDDGSGHEWEDYDGQDVLPEADGSGPDRTRTYALEPLRFDGFGTFEDLEEDPKPGNRDWRKEARRRYAEILGQTADCDSEETEEFIRGELSLDLDRFRFPEDPEWEKANPGRTRGYKELKGSEKSKIKPVEEQVQFLVDRLKRRLAEALRNAEYVEGSFQDEQFLEDREFAAALLFRAGAESQVFHHWAKYDNTIEPDDPRHKNLAGYYVEYQSQQRTGNVAHREAEKIRRRCRERSSKIHEGQQTMVDVSSVAKKKSVRRTAFDTRYNRKVGLALMRILNPDTIDFYVTAFRLNESGDVPVKVPRDRVAEVYDGTPMRTLIEDEEIEVEDEDLVFA